uniref:Rab-GAP TBC domain-containing protein n=1 Tax=Strix occidentalis caurina TaxID=311401 RepID=A0A8D0FAI6_STROC
RGRQPRLVLARSPLLRQLSPGVFAHLRLGKPQTRRTGAAGEAGGWRKKKEKLLKELIRKGIPHHFRAIVWQLLCSATDKPVKNQYSELLKMSSPCEKLIRRDIARTYPEHEFFKGQDSLGQEVLFNVMKAYSLVDREVGYCQGSAFIVGLLLMQMPEKRPSACSCSVSVCSMQSPITSSVIRSE